MVSPVPIEGEIVEAGKAETFDFYTAIKKIMEGKAVARLDWGNDDYCQLLATYLHIFKDGKFHIWQIGDGDIAATDWYVVLDTLVE